MADKKISQLPLLNSVSGSSLIVPIVHDGTTVKLDLNQLGHFSSQWSAQTGSANTFSGTQTFSGNVNINGRLTVHEIYANYETSSILYTSGSSQFGDQASDIHTFVGTINLNGLALGTNELMAQTASQAAVNLGISSTTGSINTTTSSFNSVFSAIGQQTASQDLVNRGISSVTGSINTTTSSFDNVFRRISSTTGSINTTTSSFDNVFLGISSVTGALNTTTSSFDSVFQRISSTTGSINTTTSSFDLVFRGISSVTGAMNTQSSSQDLVNRQISLVTGSIHFTTGALNAFTGSVIGQTNTISTFTSSVNFATQSLNTQTGSQDSVNLRISSTTGSINTTTSSFDSVFLRISSTTGSINTTTSSFDLVFRGISSVTGAINTTTSSFNTEFGKIGSTTASIHLTTASLNTYTGSNETWKTGVRGEVSALEAWTASLDNTYATDAQLYQLYQATASIHFTTSSLNTQTGSQDLVNRGISSVTGSINTTTSSFNTEFSKIGSTTSSIHFATSSLNTQTGSQANLNAQIAIATSSLNFATSSLNTFTGSLRSEVNLIEAYTASLKGAAIVSSSQQITNYYKFAETASANTFYGNQTFASSGGNGLRIYGASGTHQWDMYLNGQNVRLSDNTAGDGALVVDTRASFGGHVTASGNFVVATAGNGIDFSATSNGSGTTTSELLNDYEEGTWTPTVSFVGTPGTVNYVDRSGRYTKVGRLVQIEMSIVGLNITGSSGYMRISGLPFTVGSLGTYAAFAPYGPGWLNFPSSSQFFLQLGTGATTIDPQIINNSGFYQDFTANNIIGTNHKVTFAAQATYTV